MLAISSRRQSLEVIIPTTHASVVLKWPREHLLRDLRPYVCTYPDCADGDQLYDSWKDWVAHETWTHNRIWRCIKHTEKTFYNVEDFQQHLRETHTQSQAELTEITEASAVVSTNPNRLCPFCESSAKSTNKMENHVGAHLQRIALFALPRSTEHDRDSSHGSQGQSDNADLVGKDSRFDELESLDWSDKEASHVAAGFQGLTTAALKNALQLETTGTEAQAKEATTLDVAEWIDLRNPTSFLVPSDDVAKLYPTANNALHSIPRESHLTDQLNPGPLGSKKDIRESTLSNKSNEAGTRSVHADDDSITGTTNGRVPYFLLSL